MFRVLIKSVKSQLNLWSSANFFRNLPRQKKVVCMKSGMQILCFYLVAQICPVGLFPSGHFLIVSVQSNSYGNHWSRNSTFIILWRRKRYYHHKETYKVAVVSSLCLTLYMYIKCCSHAFLADSMNYEFDKLDDRKDWGEEE